MKPSERRWKWVHKDFIPPDMLKVLNWRGGKKDKVRNEKVDPNKPQEEGGVVDDKIEYITQTTRKDYLTLDYTLVLNVTETLQIVKE